jgi:hypothetical protein
MKYYISGLLFFHGAAHLLGFLMAFNLVQPEQITSDVSKVSGIFWLITFILFVVSGLLYLGKTDWWYIITFLAVVFSTVLIISVWSDAKFGTLANLKILLLVVVGFATQRYYTWYKNEVRNGLIHSESLSDSLLTEEDIRDLPEPVRKYIQYTGSVGKPKIKNFKVEFTGRIRKNEKSAWMPFTSEQYNFPNASTRLFFMNAVMKGFPVAGFHSFKNGDAFMDIRLLSLLKVQFQSGKEMGIAETVTFFNDLCFMAPATLIDKRIKWIETDGNRVHAQFTSNKITISAWLEFNDAGELTGFVSEDRYAVNENRAMERLPWLTPASDYRNLNGIRLATYAEAIYKYPAGDLCYGTFVLKGVRYNCKELT